MAEIPEANVQATTYEVCCQPPRAPGTPAS